MPPVHRRIAVIGAGPAGAIATDALVKEQAFNVIRVFDRCAGIGGIWIHTPELPVGIPSLVDVLAGTADNAVPIPAQLQAVTPASELVNNHQRRFSDTAMHEHLHTNITPEIMSFSAEAFPDTLSERALAEYGPGAPFRHHGVLREWVEGIFARNGQDGFVELNTTVERAEKVGGRWVLTLRKEKGGHNYWWREDFDALIVATGHYNVPWLPDIEGLLAWDRKFPGSVVHSKHFRSAEQFRNKV
jgi:cation diffusion facilitator CzcD-associated flavoprotein CzcO